jgi:hypothetical protein
VGVGPRGASGNPQATAAAPQTPRRGASKVNAAQIMTTYPEGPGPQPENSDNLYCESREELQKCPGTTH